MTCTYNVAGPDDPDRECGRPAACKWVRRDDGRVTVVTCTKHERVVARALGIDLPFVESHYRREDLS